MASLTPSALDLSATFDTFRRSYRVVVLVLSVGAGLAYASERAMPMALYAAVCLTLMIAIAFLRPHLLLPTLAITIPIEISKTLFPFLLLEKGVGGMPVSI